MDTETTNKATGPSSSPFNFQSILSFVGVVIFLYSANINSFSWVFCCSTSCRQNTAEMSQTMLHKTLSTLPRILFKMLLIPNMLNKIHGQKSESSFVVGFQLNQVILEEKYFKVNGVVEFAHELRRFLCSASLYGACSHNFTHQMKYSDL